MAEKLYNPRGRGIQQLVEMLPMDPTLAMRIARSKCRLSRIADAPAGGTWAAEGLAALDSAVVALQKNPRSARAAEAVWMAVHQTRQALCLRDDRAALIEIAHEVEADLTEHGVALQGTKIDLQDLVFDLVHGRGEPTSLRRNQLYALSLIAARQREADWYKVNHLVQRRFRGAVAVIGLLGVLVLVLPFGLDHTIVGQGFGEAALSWAREAACIVAVLTCGALGGLLSVLLGRERLQLTAIEHHLVVATSRLRPVMGAASAAVFFILWESGVLQMADAGQRRAGAVSGTLLLMAVVSGFSERLLLGQIERLSAAFQRATGRPAVELPPPEPPAREALAAPEGAPEKASASPAAAG